MKLVDDELVKQVAEGEFGSRRVTGVGCTLSIVTPRRDPGALLLPNPVRYRVQDHVTKRRHNVRRPRRQNVRRNVRDLI